MSPFVYPAQPHRRRHGPRGYAGYESYRDWLRDEFSFRCVYCLNHEQWVIAKGAFAIDHFETKLFKLADGFRTETGRQMAKARHERLKQVLDLFLDEI